MELEEVQILVKAEEEFIPGYGSRLAAGADVKACIEEDVWIEPGESALIPTGIKVEIPAGYEIQVRPRSGLALKNKITVLNTPGTIDADYRGEIGVILINHGKSSFQVTRGMRIAQLVLTRALKAVFVVEEKELSLTARGEGGFGHTGIH
ncbi:MAG: dUTP diphosphatase [Verrucomicrobia bacterium]|nr:dUTP diphosphatase [Verrucomicrobiota bacterium]